jgi:hypothetical protein
LPLRAWKATRATANPHLLNHRRTAPRLVPSGPSFPWKESRIRPRALREDRILHEIHATGGDVRRTYDLFGLSVEGSTRYLKTIEHPDLRNQDQPGSRP